MLFDSLQNQSVQKAGFYSMCGIALTVGSGLVFMHGHKWAQIVSSLILFTMGAAFLSLGIFYAARFTHQQWEKKQNEIRQNHNRQMNDFVANKPPQGYGVYTK